MSPYLTIADLEREVERLRAENERLRVLADRCLPRQRRRTKPAPREQRAIVRAIVESYKQPCARCGESDLSIMQFHHLNPATKDGDVGKMIEEAWTGERVRAELDKCVCLCPTCHAKSHRKR